MDDAAFLRARHIVGRSELPLGSDANRDYELVKAYLHESGLERKVEPEPPMVGQLAIDDAA